MRAGGPDAQVDLVLDMTSFLLEVMRLQEHALRPDDLAAPTHLVSIRESALIDPPS
jgi:hypothetical protein